MKRADRRLSAAEAALWARLAGTVLPIAGKQHPPQARPENRVQPRFDGGARPVAPVPIPGRNDAPPPRARLGEDRHRNTLDASWDRKLAQGKLHPDFTLDLHGCSLDAAHARLDHGLTLALAQGARVVLLITGRPRPADPGGRGERRGAIRAKFLDWLRAGSHASRIAAVRPAHPRHGGAGAVYLVLRRGR